MPDVSCVHCGKSLLGAVSTMQERAAAELLSGKHKSVGAALRVAGYQPSTSRHPAAVLRTPGMSAKVAELTAKESAKKRGLTDTAKSIQRQALDIISGNVGAIRDASPREAIQLAGGTLKVTSDYLRDAPEDDERTNLDDVQALASRLVAGGIRLGASLGARAAITLERYARRLDGTRYALRPSGELTTGRRALPARGDTSGQHDSARAGE